MPTAKPCAIVPLRGRAGAAVAAPSELPADLTTGSVAIDVGDEAGALIILTDSARLGQEIEVTPLRGGQSPRHVAVLARRVATTTMYAAVFGDLLAGGYLVPSGGDSPAMLVEVEPGTVVELDQRQR